MSNLHWRQKIKKGEAWMDGRSGQERSAYTQAKVEHADDAKKVAEAEKDSEAKSRQVTPEEQAAFKKMWLKGGQG